MLHMVRIPAALVMAPRVMRVRSLGTGVRRRLRFLRSQRDQRRRREQNGDQNLFHLMSPQREFPCNPEPTPMRGKVQVAFIAMPRKVDLPEAAHDGSALSKDRRRKQQGADRHRVTRLGGGTQPRDLTTKTRAAEIGPRNVATKPSHKLGHKTCPLKLAAETQPPNFNVSRKRIASR